MNPMLILLFGLSVGEDRCSSNWLPRSVGDSSDDIYFYCMTVVESTVLVFGSCES